MSAEIVADEEPKYGLGDLLATLVDLRTLPHVILLMLLSALLYILTRSSATGAVWASVAFLSLSIGYVLTAALTRLDIIHKLVRVDGINRDSWLTSLLLNSLRAWTLPLLLSGGVAVGFATMLNHDARLEKWLPLALASLFLLWSAGQALSFRAGTTAWIAGHSRSRNQQQRNGGISGFITIHMLIITLLAASLTYTFGYSARPMSEADFSTHITWIGYFVMVIGIQIGLIWWLMDLLSQVSETKGGARFTLWWSVLSQSFVAWHMCSAFRRLLDEPSAIAMIIEELLLMLLAIVFAIWALASRGVNRGSVLFTSRNALFWGLAFGFGYAGSISMITRITDLFGDANIHSTMAIGHIITVLTLLWLHPATLSSHALGMGSHVDNSEVENIVEIELDELDIIEDEVEIAS